MSGLQRKGKRVTKAVRLMTDPNPQFVSLVSNGANQTPFKAVKSDGQEGETEVVVAGVRATDTSEPSEDVMSKKAQAGNKPAKKLVVRTAGDGPDLHKLVFAASNFDSEKAVRSYLDGKGYEGGEINALDDGGFEVVAREAEDFESTEVIDGDDGVARHVGVVKAGEEDEGEEESEESEADKGEEDEQDTSTKDEGEDEGKAPAESEEGEEVAKGDESEGDESDKGGEKVAKAMAEQFPNVAEFLPQEQVTKYDGWMANYSAGKSIKDVMAAGADGLPPAIYEVNDAFYTALRNLILDGETDKINTLTTEFGQMITTLTATLNFATVPAEIAQKFLGEQAGEGKEKATKSDKPSEIDTDAVAQKAAELVLSQLGEAGITAESLQLVSKSVDDKAKEQADKLSQVEKQAEEQGKTITELSQKLDEVTGRAKRLESVSVASRALDFDNVPEGSESKKTQKSSEQDDSTLRNELGFG